jgi:Flp pilus assembly protein TadG
MTATLSKATIWVSMMNTLLFMMNGISRLISNRDGNFAMVTAIVLPVLIGSAGVAIDLSNMTMQKRQLQDAADSAALAAATALANGKVTTDAQAQALAKDFVVGQMANSISASDTTALKNSTTVTITTTTTATSKSYKVNVNAGYSMSLTPLMKVLGQDSVAIASNSTSTSGISEQRSAVSMTMILDQSGSMLADTSTLDPNKSKCAKWDESGTQITERSGWTTITEFSPCYIKKIDALKTAANLLLDELEKADPSKPAKYSRTNAIGWNNIVRSSSNFVWGTKDTRTLVNGLSGGNGTESYAPMKAAHAGLLDSPAGSEAKVQAAAGNTKLTKYIVFMTDGNNNATSSDTNTLNECTTAKNTDNIKIYSVAFMAPAGGRGQALLRSCASSPSYYFQAESMSDLVAAFQKIGQDAASDKTLLTQ